MILEVYINSLGMAFEGKSRSREKIKFPPLKVVCERERDILVTFVFSSQFSIFLFSPWT